MWGMVSVNVRDDENVRAENVRAENVRADNVRDENVRMRL
jgi:hypothetical protein